MNIPSNLRYTKDHEWLQADGGVATLGVSDYAQDALGDVVFLELPEPGAKFAAGDAIGVIESVKAASDIYTPVSGEIVAANKDLLGAPEAVNKDPYGSWMIKIRLADAAEVEALMDATAYAKYVAEIKK